jgi:ApaG protein
VLESIFNWLLSLKKDRYMKAGVKFTATTNSIEVSVQPVFLPDQTIKAKNFFVWAYNVEIVNLGHKTIQLKNRYWRIIDENGGINEVRGAGVVGEQPILKEGEKFQYSSGTYLSTPSGVMEGTYEMEALDTGDTFNITIPTFSLDSPYEEHKPS